MGLTTVTPLDQNTTESITRSSDSTCAHCRSRCWPARRLRAGPRHSRQTAAWPAAQSEPRLINDADVQRWYFRLKKSFEAWRADGGEFQNPVRETTLRWRSYEDAGMTSETRDTAVCYEPRSLGSARSSVLRLSESLHSVSASFSSSPIPIRFSMFRSWSRSRLLCFLGFLGYGPIRPSVLYRLGSRCHSALCDRPIPFMEGSTPLGTRSRPPIFRRRAFPWGLRSSRSAH